MTRLMRKILFQAIKKAGREDQRDRYTRVLIAGSQARPFGISLGSDLVRVFVYEPRIRCSVRAKL